jgi:murein DD-endopeptidase MepM/ murein hydrolase activator NlpD
MGRPARTRAGQIVFGLALACFLPAAPALAREWTPQHRDAVRRTLAEFVASRHWNPQAIDLEAVLAGYERRFAAGDSDAALADWSTRELGHAFHAFAPLGVEPPPHRYRYPFEAKIPRFLGQGNGGAYSHADVTNRYAFDFIMPVGTPVLAARPGKVARVIDGFVRCCLPAELGYQSNTVLVLHEDGSIAEYTHLRSGIPVKEGQEVALGEVLAGSGNSGQSDKPHLHFAVHVRTPDGWRRSIPIEFRRGRRTGHVPEQGGFVGVTPPSNAELRILAGGVEVGGERFVDARQGARLRLTVELLAPGASARDVSVDPHIRYVPLTPWQLAAGPTGSVVLVRDPVWKDLSRGVNRAILRVLYEDEGRGVRAIEDVVFRLDEPAQAGSPAP